MDLKIPGYEIFEKIGEGGMARVYRAKHQRLNRDVALKVMLNRYSDDPEFAERFIREARIAASLNHPNIVHIYDVNRSSEILFLAMEFVGGGDLSEKYRPPINQKILIKIISQLCEALDFAHEQGYIHRDIKPANILFRDNGSLALSDFGIARAIYSNTHMTQTGTVIGTPSYMSPEQAQGFQLTGQSDLYSAAVIAYQYVTGELPYRADSSITVAIKHINAPVPELSEPFKALQPFFNRALAKTPDERYANGSEMVKALYEAIASLPEIEPTSNNTLIVDPAQRITGIQSMTLDSPDVNALESTLLETASDTSETAVRPVSHPSVQQQVANISEPKKPEEALGQLKSNKNNLVVLAGVLCVVALAVALFVKLMPQQEPLSNEDKLKIARLLVEAENLRESGDWVSPSGKNAYENYQKVLVLSPDDVIAHSGVESIKNALSAQAMAYLDDNKLLLARDTLDELKRIDLNHPTINPIEDKIEQQFAARAARVKENIAQARLLLENSEYQGAMNRLRNAREEESAEREATQVITQFIQQSMNEADEYTRSEHYQKADTLLDAAGMASELLPNSEFTQEIFAQRKQNASSEQDKKNEEKILEWLRLARQAEAKGNLYLPKGSSALQYYLKVLNADRNRSEAKKGRERALSSLASDARREIERKNLVKAQSLIDLLASYIGRGAKVAELDSALRTQEKNIAKAEANQKKINALYKRADSALKKNRAKSADKVHAQIKRLNPNDAGLPALSRKVADAYAVLAQREIDAKDWEDVEVWVKKGLVHVPGHQRLLELQRYADKMMGR